MLPRLLDLHNSPLTTQPHSIIANCTLVLMLITTCDYTGHCSGQRIMEVVMVVFHVARLPLRTIFVLMRGSPQNDNNKNNKNEICPRKQALKTSL